MQLAPLFPFLYRGLNPLFPDCLWSGDGQRPVVALTFDDGPHPQYSGELLEVLDQYGVPASFFWLGACVRRAPDLARKIYQRQHWIGLHGYDHRSFPGLSASQLQTTLVQTQAEITAACGLPATSVRDVRPPNGLFTPHTLNLLRQWDYRPVMWSVVPEDWVHPGVETTLQRVLQQVKNGSIIVLHDGVCGGADVAATVDRLIPALLDRQYHFCTIDQFWQSHQTQGATTKR